MDTMCFGYRGILSVSFTNCKEIHKYEVQHYQLNGITPPRMARISGLESQLLKIPFLA